MAASSSSLLKRSSSTGQQKSLAEPAKGTISESLLVSASAGVTLGKEEDVKRMLSRRVTHLNLQDKGLTSLAGIGICAAVKVIYAYNNSITTLDGGVLEGLDYLSLLYLEHNRLTSFEGIEAVGPSVKKLFVNGNRFTGIGGALVSCRQLEELHMSGQHFPHPNMSFSFDPLAMRALASTLRVLNLSACNLQDQDLVNLFPLKHLDTVDLSKNQLVDLRGLCECVSTLHALSSLDVRGNPVTDPLVTGAGGAYRAALIAAVSGSPCFSVLDGQAVKGKHRAFVAALATQRGGRGGGIGEGGEDSVYSQGGSMLGSRNSIYGEDEEDLPPPGAATRMRHNPTTQGGGWSFRFWDPLTNFIPPKPRRRPGPYNTRGPANGRRSVLAPISKQTGLYSHMTNNNNNFYNTNSQNNAASSSVSIEQQQHHQHPHDDEIPHEQYQQNNTEMDRDDDAHNNRSDAIVDHLQPAAEMHESHQHQQEQHADTLTSNNNNDPTLPSSSSIATEGEVAAVQEQQPQEQHPQVSSSSASSPSLQIEADPFGGAPGPEETDEVRTGSDSRIRISSRSRVRTSSGNGGADNGRGNGSDSLRSSIEEAHADGDNRRESDDVSGGDAGGRGGGGLNLGPDSFADETLTSALLGSTLPRSRQGGLGIGMIPGGLSTVAESTEILGGLVGTSSSRGGGGEVMVGYNNTTRRIMGDNGNEDDESRPVFPENTTSTFGYQNEDMYDDEEDGGNSSGLPPRHQPQQHHALPNIHVPAAASTNNNDAAAAAAYAAYRAKQLANANAVGDASGFNSQRPVHLGATNWQEAYVPARTPSDFMRSSRFRDSGYAAGGNTAAVEQQVAATLIAKAKELASYGGLGGGGGSFIQSPTTSLVVVSQISGGTHNNHHHQKHPGQQNKKNPSPSSSSSTFGRTRATINNNGKNNIHHHQPKQQALLSATISSTTAIPAASSTTTLNNNSNSSSLLFVATASASGTFGVGGVGQNVLGGQYVQNTTTTTTTHNRRNSSGSLTSTLGSVITVDYAYANQHQNQQQQHHAGGQGSVSPPPPLRTTKKDGGGLVVAVGGGASIYQPITSSLSSSSQPSLTSLSPSASSILAMNPSSMSLTTATNVVNQYTVGGSLARLLLAKETASQPLFPSVSPSKLDASPPKQRLGALKAIQASSKGHTGSSIVVGGYSPSRNLGPLPEGFGASSPWTQ